MDSKTYLPRIFDTILKEKLGGTGAVLIEGAKWCGKTTTAEQQAKSVLYMDNPSQVKENLIKAELNPELLLIGQTPRLIDEWQIAPQLWDAVRFTVDHRQKDGQFILTGSAVPLLDEQQKRIMHTGTGRITRIKMRPMSLWESGDSEGAVSMRQLFDGTGETTFGSCSSDLRETAFLACRGGWPRAVQQSKKVSLGRAFDYLTAVVESDIQRVGITTRNAQRAARIMRSYARLQGSQAPLAVICQDIAAGQEGNVDPRKVSSYLDTLRKIFVIEDMEAWNPNLRSRTAIRTSDTRYFTDPSIAVAALGIGPENLMADLNTFGFIFETLCMRDLRIYSQALEGQVYHFRDKNNLECDAVVHLRDGRYGLVEVKLGGDKLINEGAANLVSLENKIDTSRMFSPSFKMILTAVGTIAYLRSDGVWVVPIRLLRD